MKRFALTALLLALIGSSGCNAPSMRSNVMANPAYDLSTMKTYAWQGKQTLVMIGVLTGAPNQPIEDNLKRIFSEAMAQKGYTRVKISDHPDFLVAFTAGAMDTATDSVHSVNRSRVYHDQAVWVQSNDYLEGGLAIMFLDPVNKATMWQGTAGDRVKPRDSKKEDGSTIKRLVDEILKTIQATTL